MALYSMKNICEGSFFERSQLSLNKSLLLLHHWAKQFAVKDAADDADIHKNSACDVIE